MNRRNRRIRPRQPGLSLIELMVALAIGSLLILALVQVFGASRAAYALSAGLARTQENGRFAIDILQRDLRMAGHLGCVNDQARFLPANVTASRPALISTFMTDDQRFNGQYGAVTNRALRFDVGVEAYEAVGTGNGSNVTLSAAPTVAAAAADWYSLPDTLFADMRGNAPAGTPGKPVLGSDVLVLRFFSPQGAQVTSFTPAASTGIGFVAGHGGRLTEGVTNPGLFGIADCMQAAVFSATTTTITPTVGAMTVAASGLNLSGFQATTPFTIGQATLYRAESLVYYVGINASGNPALYRLRYGAAPGGAMTTPTPLEELVEGVESLQLEFGQDSQTAAAQRPTGNIGSSLTANALQPSTDPDTAWRRVGVVRVGLVARSPDPASAEQRDTASGVARPLSAMGVVFTPPDDTRYRAAYEDTVALRNRLFGN